MTRIRRWQLGLILFGIALLGIGVFVLFQEVNPKRYIGILTWLVAALVIHDGIIAPAVFAVSLASRKLGRRVPQVIIAIVQGALVIGGVVTLIVVPEILKKSIGTLSSSILPQNYLLNLFLFYGVLVIATAAIVVGYYRRFARRANVRSSEVHD
ncbi:MAG TPA: hypothetical protein VGM94_07060 [Galbitalea sp.]|jgi:hypothetical protein